MDRLKLAFDQFEAPGTGGIPAARAEEALRAAGVADVASATAMLKTLDPDRSSTIGFEQFCVMAQARAAPPSNLASPSAAPPPTSSVRRDSEILAGINAMGVLPGQLAIVGPSGIVEPALDEGGDPKVEEFLRILEEYRGKCEVEGNYEEAARATEQLSSLRKQEEARRIKALKLRQMAEKGDIAQGQAAQYSDFNNAWDRYLAEYDAMASMYVRQMQERQTDKLREFQERLHTDLTKRPVKFGRELLEWRAREQLLAKQKKYGEAARIKAVADELERRERAKLDEERLSSFAQKEAKFRTQHAAELQALLKRIETRRAEHVKQRDLDSKRLVQRNKNVMAVLEQRQLAEEAKKVAEIRAQLAPPRSAYQRLQPLDTGNARHKMDMLRGGKGGSPQGGMRSDSPAQGVEV